MDKLIKLAIKEVVEKHNPHTVQEIAFNLGFGRLQHFNKIFNSKAELTPAKYRNLN